MLQNNKLRKNITSNIIRSLIGGVILFVIFRYLSLKLGTNDFGVWTTVISITAIFRLASLGLAHALSRQISIKLISGKRQVAIIYIETTLITVLLIYFLCLPFMKIGIDFGIEHVFSGNNVEKAMSIGLSSLILVIISELGIVFHSIIEGFQRMEVNAIISIAGQLAMLLLVLILVPAYGLNGVILSQLAQSFIILILSWLWVKSQFPRLRIIPRKWSANILKNLLPYGSNISLINAASFLMDPITKIFLTKIGGATLTTYFELSSQFIQRIRGILLTANSAVIPRIAEYTNNFKESIKEIYIENLKIALILSLSIYSMLIASNDILSIVMFKFAQPDFKDIFNILAICWLINALSAPAYFSNLGTGEVGVNSISQIMMGLLNLVFCYFYGGALNGLGVIASYAAAISISSISMYIFYHKYMNISFNIFISKKEMKLFVYLLSIFILSLIFSSYYDENILLMIFKVVIIGLLNLLIIYRLYLYYKNNEYYKYF